MRRSTTVTAVIAGGAVVTALIATPSLALASTNDVTADTGSSVSSSAPYARSLGQPTDRSNRAGMRQAGGDGAGARRGAARGAGKSSADGRTNVASGTVSAEQTSVLTEMAAEEKLAHDLYIAFDGMYDETVFSRIANSETKHLSSVRVLLERYDVADTTLGLTVGVFPTEATQNLYDTLLAQGSASLDAAKEVARTVEETDIADLTAAAVGVTAPDVLAVYANLLTASQHHLVAFGG